ncbi:hypothetical protein DFH08DRAFT_799106 [Mycena albidolilacea]|uniref:Uncharacterized protein n=1 Tax=Mycena albidolilacea TaxID=1033008 RepID=A0AAD7F3V3_9AGAR|nr:hypothetical protein DFH08DRAFT_799106 [Mycena albidolilacea]
MVVPNVDKLTVPFTFAIYPRVVIPFGALLNNLSEVQTSKIKAKPTDFLAIVPHSTGRLFYQEHKYTNHDALTFIKIFSVAGINIRDIDIALPILRHKPKSNFDGPWLIIMTGASEELVKFLTWHQTFSVNRKLNFHALRFDPNLDLWVIMTTSGDTVHESDKANVSTPLYQLTSKLITWVAKLHYTDAQSIELDGLAMSPTPPHATPSNLTATMTAMKTTATTMTTATATTETAATTTVDEKAARTVAAPTMDRWWCIKGLSTLLPLQPN